MTSVIIVDDDRGTVEVFSEYLQTKGIDVLGVGYNGKQTLELYKKLKPDVILLDVMMPEFDGFYGLKEIRQYDPNAKVVVVTADLTADTELKLKELNASAIAYKPYDIENIIATIDKVSKGEVVVFTPPS